MEKLEHKEGFLLTNGEIYADGDVYLGTADKAENWRYIPVEEVEN